MLPASRRSAEVQGVEVATVGVIPPVELQQVEGVNVHPAQRPAMRLVHCRAHARGAAPTGRLESASAGAPR